MKTRIKKTFLLPNLLLLFFFIIIPCEVTVRSQIIVSSPFENSKFIEIEEVRLHYRTWFVNDSHQTMPWILLVHGFSGSTHTWNKNVESLNNAGFNVIAVDVPPFGYSDKSRKLNHSEDNRANLLWKFANYINPDAQWHLFGHSMGGGIVAAMAILQPQKVDRVILVAPALFGRLKPGRSIRQRIVAFPPFEWMLGVMGNIILINPKRIEKLVESAYGQKGTPEDVMAYYTPLKQKGMARAILSAYSRANPSQPLSIADFKSEALAIWGEKDSWVPYERIKPYTEAMENLSIVIIKDTGHNPMETDAELFNRIVLEYLSEKKQ